MWCTLKGQFVDDASTLLDPDSMCSINRRQGGKQPSLGAGLTERNRILDKIIFTLLQFECQAMTFRLVCKSFEYAALRQLEHKLVDCT